MKSPVVIIAVILTLMSCSKNQTKDSNQEFKKDQIAFVNSLELFKKGQLKLYGLLANTKTFLENYGTNKDSIIVFNVRYKKECYAVFETYKKAITESEKVSDNYLDFLHSEFKTMYRDKFVAAMKLAYESGVSGINSNFSEESMRNGAEANKKVDEMLQSFWGYVESIQQDIADKHPDVEQVLVRIVSGNAPKEGISAQKKSENVPNKSFWRMLLRFFLADFVAILIFSFLVVILISPLGLLAGKISKGLTTIMSFPFLIIAGLSQAYLWILWAAFCAYTIKFYMDAPTVTQHWLYYITGFFAAATPLGWLGNQESQSASSYDEKRNTDIGTMGYSLITIIAFVIFCIWTNLLDFKYISWLNHWLY